MAEVAVDYYIATVVLGHEKFLLNEVPPFFFFWYELSSRYGCGLQSQVTCSVII